MRYIQNFATRLPKEFDTFSGNLSFFGGGSSSQVLLRKAVTCFRISHLRGCLSNLFPFGSQSANWPGRFVGGEARVWGVPVAGPLFSTAGM